jgi:hypothetical protein
MNDKVSQGQSGQFTVDADWVIGDMVSTAWRAKPKT